MKKVWHPYWLWEDYKAGMWRKVQSKDREQLLAAAIDFTGDHERYGAYMRKIIFEWPLASEHNLTDIHVNRLAWIGHSACCMATGCPEDVTRQAWGHLSQDQQDLANAQADSALKEWEVFYKGKNTQLCLSLEG